MLKRRLKRVKQKNKIYHISKERSKGRFLLFDAKIRLIYNYRCRMNINKILIICPQFKELSI